MRPFAPISLLLAAAGTTYGSGVFSSSDISSSAPMAVPAFTGTGGHYPFPPSGTGSPSRPPMSACWQTCFTASNITYPEALCFEHPGDEVSQCVQATCENSGETNAYYQWVQKFCAPPATGEPLASASTSSHVESTSSHIEATSSSILTSFSEPAISSASISVSHSVSHSAPEHPPIGTGSPAPPNFPPLPPCWQECFTQFNISNPQSLCSEYPGSAVSSCIKTGCEANSTQAYFGWVQSFCLRPTGNKKPASSSSSSTEPEHTSSSSVAATSSSIAHESSSSMPLISETSSAIPHPTGGPIHPSIPCWGRCFAQYNVSSAESLCSRHPGQMVHSCISVSCAVNETTAYDHWVQSACHDGSSSSALPSMSSIPATSSSSIPATSSVPSESTSISSSSVEVHPTSGEATFPQPTGGASYPPCWGQCFAESHIVSPQGLCVPPTSDVVGECIAQSCDANATARYEGWKHKFCNHSMPTGSESSHYPSSPSVSISSSGEPTHSASSSIPHDLTSSSSILAISISSSVQPPLGTGSPHPPPTNHSMPACWTQCFQVYHVSNSTSLCSTSTGDAVGSCIAATCDGTDVAQYAGWKARFCSSPMPSGSASSSSYPAEPTVSASTSSASSSVPEILPTTSSVAAISSIPAHPTASVPPPSGNHTAPDMPKCWYGCFTQFNVSDPRALCAPALGSLVETCVSSACNSTESGRFEGWLNDFCRKPEPTVSASISSSSYSYSTSSESVSLSVTHSASVSVSVDPTTHSASVTASHSETASYPPFPPSGTGVPTHPNMPACWTTCFASSHVTTPASLCHPPMGPIVDNCIASTCRNGTEAAAYNAWLNRFCNSTTPIPSGSAVPSTSSYAASTSSYVTTTSSSLDVSTSSYPVDPVSSSKPTESASISSTPHFPPSGTGIPHPPSGQFPPCWGACFAQNHIVGKSALCLQPTKDAVSGCIAQSCAANETVQYTSWLASFCPATTAGSSSSVEASITPSASVSHSVSVSASESTHTATASASSTVSSSVIVDPSNSHTPVPPNNNTQIPQCWTTCFKEHNVPSKDSLCDPELTAYVAACIESSCEAGSSDKYAHWVGEYCEAPTPPSHSSAPVIVEPSATASPSQSEIASSSSAVVVDPAETTSSAHTSSTASASASAEPSAPGNPQGPPHGPPNGQPGQPGRPPVNGPPPHNPNQPQTTPVNQPTPTSSLTTSATPIAPTTPTVPTTPTTMTTVSKPTPTPNGPPAGYPGASPPWGNGPPPWFKGGKPTGPPPPAVLKSIIEKMKGWIGGVMG